MSANLASLERRLSKMEASRRPPRGLFYVAWGSTPAEIEASLDQARHARAIADGDPVVRCAWPVEYPIPASRWARNDMREFDKIEFGALMGEVDRFQDGLLAAVRAEARRRGEPDPDPDQIEIEAVTPERDEKARTMTDAALIGVVLAVPLNGARTSLTEDRLWRIISYTETLGVRDRIRGRDDALLRATQCAGRTTTH
ncbi:hypothetical protein [Methylobacterium longum]|uniref:Uncharacterized protein n=1 Tax=Methylobacterium longum TaxID=767694 RepID=A0ABT8AYQ9_9HYPH|nr:hypothetical protein [Methylobacterium longum]MDN3575137.1 hypothetical protein [Methylobacterium longum]GJE14794.1 hypothetical protein FOHLNKBM_5869 [Methylobacterium longum]